MTPERALLIFILGVCATFIALAWIGSRQKKREDEDL